MGVTIKQIAIEVGLSWPAVSQILNHRGRFAPETRKRVLAAAAKHGYRPNSSARALRGQSSKLVGILFRNDAGNPFTNMAAFEYLLGINQRFQEADYGTLLIRAGELSQSAEIEPRVFRENLVDGVIVVGGLTEPLVSRVRSLAQRLVWLDAQVWEKTCCIRRDEKAAGGSCVKALAELGYKEVTFVARDAIRVSGHHSHKSREAGARAAAKALGIRFRFIHWAEDNSDEEFEVLQELLSPEVGIVAGSLPVARRIVTGAASMNLSPGYDYGIVCCDDSFETFSGFRGLSRATFNRYHLGEGAAEMMLNLIETPDVLPQSILQPDAWFPGCTAWGPTPVARPK